LANQEKRYVKIGKNQDGASARSGGKQAKTEHLPLQSLHLRGLPVLN
jgi:hypothetical protein